MIKQLDNILLSQDATSNFYKSYKNPSFKNWLLSVLPEIEKCQQQQQDNPWHIYSCLDHILHSVDEINKQTTTLNEKTRRMLAYVMFFHDIGKPECYVRRYSTLYGKEVDSFFGHNLASAKIAERALPLLNFSPNEINIMKKLIEDHDIFMFITIKPDGNPHHNVLSQDLVDKHIKQLSSYGNGAELLYYLTMIGLADNLAQNPKMTAQSIKMVKTMQNMINYNKPKEIMN